MSTQTSSAEPHTDDTHVEVHREPFVVLADLTHERALVTWGAFYFVRHHPEQRWEVVEDPDPPDLVGRSTCIGTAARRTHERAAIRRAG